MLAAKITEVDVAHCLPGNAPSPWGVRSNWRNTKYPGILPGVCVLSLGIQQEMLLDWVKKEVFCLEEKVGQHWDRKQE